MGNPSKYADDTEKRLAARKGCSVGAYPFFGGDNECAIGLVCLNTDCTWSRIYDGTVDPSQLQQDAYQHEAGKSS